MPCDAKEETRSDLKENLKNKKVEDSQPQLQNPETKAKNLLAQFNLTEKFISETIKMNINDFYSLSKMN